MIHVVDDDDSVRTSLVRLIRSAGLQARSFATAEDFLNEAPDPEGAVAIIDVHLPGMTGLELQGELQRLGRNFPIIMITALEDADVRRTAESAKVVGLLIKPFGEGELLQLIDQAMKSTPPGAGQA